jgi:hypothetical protein
MTLARIFTSRMPRQHFPIEASDSLRGLRCGRASSHARFALADLSSPERNVARVIRVPISKPSSKLSERTPSDETRN